MKKIKIQVILLYTVKIFGTNLIRKKNKKTTII